MSKFSLTITNRNIAAQIASLLNLGRQQYYTQTEVSVLNSNVKYIVELCGEQVIGVIGLEQKSSQITEIKHLCVHPNFRRRGLGLKLLKKGIEYSNTEFVYDTVRDDNPSSIGNNFRAGFKPVAKYRSRGRYIIIFARRRNNKSHDLLDRRT